MTRTLDHTTFRACISSFKEVINANILWCPFMITNELRVPLHIVVLLSGIISYIVCSHYLEDRLIWSSLRPGEITPSYILHTRAFGTYFFGGLLPYKKNYKVMVFTCKKPANIICDVILHVNMFHYFQIPYFTCNYFIKFTYNEYIGPYFLSHIVLQFLPSDLPRALGAIKVFWPPVSSEF